MKIPTPGAAVRGSTSGRPIMALLDLLGRRMALRILWELAHAQKALKFRALQDAADTNPALLNTRLKELREARLLAHDEGGYRLTSEGKDLSESLLPLVVWADGWASGFPSEACAQKKRPRAKAGPLKEKS